MKILNAKKFSSNKSQILKLTKFYHKKNINKENLKIHRA